MSSHKEEKNAKGGENTSTAPTNFIHAMVERDLANDKYQRTLATRFPPEPNGYLHIGHAKSICLNFGIALKYGGKCHLRFDDTNPATEDLEYVESIKRDVKWLGFDWGENLFFASDYYDKLYGYAVQLIKDGKAYVCSLNEEEIREYRGTVTEAGKASPYRDRSIEENLELLEKMRAGEFKDGEHVVRAKIDMASANMKMRDPLIYRIRHMHHFRTGDKWCIYPMYDFAHGLSDSIEGITHSICTLEFENNRELYDWFVNAVGIVRPPEQTEFARLKLTYCMMSKRRLLLLVNEKIVNGWDDPRMPTVSGMRRRGYSPEAIRDFCETVGVAKANSVVDSAQLDFCLRKDLNVRSPRVMCVIDPIKVVLENYPEDKVEEFEVASYSAEIGKEGSRVIPFTRELYIERDDFMENPVKGFRRLIPGGEVRLRNSYTIKCNEVIKNHDGEVVELRCSYDPETRGKAPSGRKVKGIVHWVSAAKGVPVEVRLYDHLFTAEQPDATENFREHLNPDSLKITKNAWIEPSVLEGPASGARYQFERLGFFFSDPIDSKEGALVFNRTIALRDSWSKAKAETTKETAKAEKPKKAAKKKKPKKEKKVVVRERTPEMETRFVRYKDELGLSEKDADLLSSEEAIARFFEDGLGNNEDPKGVANWVINSVLRERKEKTLAELPFGGLEIGDLVNLINAGTISTKIAKQVFSGMMAGEGKPEEIVEAKGLKQISSPEELMPFITEALEKNAAEVERFKAGEKKLMGFFAGQIMKASRGKANPRVVNSLLSEALNK